MARTISEAFEEANAIGVGGAIAEDALIEGVAFDNVERAEIVEQISKWDPEELRRLHNALDAYRIKHGFAPLKFSDENEDAFQDAIAHILRYPPVGFELRWFEGLVVWNAARRRGNPKWKKAGELDTVHFSRLPEHFVDDEFDDAEEGIANADLLLELWYLRHYLDHLFTTTTKSVDVIAEELGVRRVVVERARRRLRHEVGTTRHANLARAWSTRTSCIDGLRTWVETHGSAPLTKDLNTNPLALPYPERLVELFGSRRAAFKAAGIKMPSKRGLKADPEELARELAAWVTRHGYWPGQREIDRTPELRSASTYRRVFETTSGRGLRDAVGEVLGPEALESLPARNVKFGRQEERSPAAQSSPNLPSNDPKGPPPMVITPSAVLSALTTRMTASQLGERMNESPRALVPLLNQLHAEGRIDRAVDSGKDDVPVARFKPLAGVVRRPMWPLATSSLSLVGEAVRWRRRGTCHPFEYGDSEFAMKVSAAMGQSGAVAA